LAEVGWTPQASRNITDFAARLGPHLLRLKRAGIVFRVPMPDAVAGAPGTPGPGTIHIRPPYDGAEVRYTTDGSDPLDSPTAAGWEGKPVQGKAAAFRARTFIDGLPGPMRIGARPETTGNTMQKP
jgi:hexosaminidase